MLYKIFLVAILLPSALLAEDFDHTVIPIAQAKPGVQFRGPRLPRIGVGLDLGTGFCVDAECRLIGTNYHIAMLVRPRKIKGERIIRRYFATGPDDHGATPNEVATKFLTYAKSRDLAIFELQRPLAHHYGVGYALGDLEPGQEVEIYAFPFEPLHPVRELLQFQGSFKAPTTNGLLAFDYSLSNGNAIRGGASGGIVVDKKTQKIVGILSEVARNNELVALAVPVQALVDFVSKTQPYLAQNLFPSARAIQPITADLYPRFVPSPVNVLLRRMEEPFEIKLLREKAQQLAESMRNFVAVQSFAWGSDLNLPNVEAQYEVQVIDGKQTFRNYPDGKFTDVAYPAAKGWVLPADEWSILPKMVGSELRLKVRQVPNQILNGQTVKVFQYYASAEDNLCPFEPVEDYGFFTIAKTVSVACYGEVWTDEDTNIIRISENLDLSDSQKQYRGWQSFRVLLTYDWLRLTEDPAWLVPLTIFTEAHDKKHVYWCRGHFTDYRMFSAKARLIAGSTP